MGATGNSRTSARQNIERENKSSSVNTIDKISTLKGADASHKELSEALNELSVNTKFYLVTEDNGELTDTVEVVKKDDENYTINGVLKTRSKLIQQYLKSDITGTVQSQKPDTSSSFEILGKKGTSIDGLQYAKAKYDILQKNSGKVRKVSVEGRVTTYNDTEYGVEKLAGGGYQITHIPTGIAYPKHPFTMKEASAAIKDFDNAVKKMDTKHIENLKKRFENTLRG